MSAIIHYTNCPVCGAAFIKNVLTAKDYTVSGEQFPIMECENCTGRFTQNIPDASSIGAYYKSKNYISHTNTDKGLVNILYQTIRKKTLPKKRRLVERQTGVKKGIHLDMGSGTGAFANEMKQAGWQVTALEPDADARAVGKQQFNIDLEDTGRFYELSHNSYDAITMWHVLEHVHDLHGYMTQLRSLLKDTGRLFIAVPNYTSKDAAVYKEFWAAYDVPRHLYHFSPKAMKMLVEKHGMKILHYKPMWYDSFYVSMLSSKYKNGKMNLFAAFFNGQRSNFKAMFNTRRCSSVIYVIGK